MMLLTVLLLTFFSIQFTLSRLASKKANSQKNAWWDAKISISLTDKKIHELMCHSQYRLGLLKRCGIPMRGERYLKCFNYKCSDHKVA